MIPGEWESSPSPWGSRAAGGHGGWHRSWRLTSKTTKQNAERRNWKWWLWSLNTHPQWPYSSIETKPPRPTQTEPLRTESSDVWAYGDILIQTTTLTVSFLTQYLTLSAISSLNILTNLPELLPLRWPVLLLSCWPLFLCMSFKYCISRVYFCSLSAWWSLLMTWSPVLGNTYFTYFSFMYFNFVKVCYICLRCGMLLYQCKGVLHFFLPHLFS